MKTVEYIFDYGTHLATAEKAQLKVSIRFPFTQSEIGISNGLYILQIQIPTEKVDNWSGMELLVRIGAAIGEAIAIKNKP